MDFEKYNLHLKVLAAIDMAPSNKIVERVKYAAGLTYEDSKGNKHKFTWRTISTWYYRFKKNGHTGMGIEPRSDKGKTRKVCVEKVAEAINEVLPLLRPNKGKKLIIVQVYRLILEKGYYKPEEFSESTFRGLVRRNNLIDAETNKNFRLKFSMLHANEMWQVDTMVGPYVHDPIKNAKRKTYLIAFIDDASRLIVHAEFFFHDNTESLAASLQMAMTKRGKPQIIYCDNGANYSSESIRVACVRLGIKLSHAPIRDGSAKGKIERFFRTFRDQFLTINHDLSSLEELNRLTTRWVEDDYNDRFHSAIQMKPIDRFAIDRSRIEFLPSEEYIDEVFFVEEKRLVAKDNTFRFDNQLFEAPVHLRRIKIQIRFHPKKRDRVLVYLDDKKLGQAHLLQQHFNARTFRKNEERKEVKDSLEKLNIQTNENQYYERKNND